MITIVIPVRNATATLGACLDALARQTLAGGYEIIVVNDGSTDDTHALAVAHELEVPLEKIREFKTRSYR